MTADMLADYVQIRLPHHVPMQHVAHAHQANPAYAAVTHWQQGCQTQRQLPGARSLASPLWPHRHAQLD